MSRHESIRAVGLRLFALIVIGGFAPTAIVAAGTVVVHPGQSIQAAIDAAAPGTTIVVRAGTYRENLEIVTDGLRTGADIRFSHNACGSSDPAGLCGP